MAEEKKSVIIITKKAKGGHGHHGGAWKVAYADFVTAMMALFMVLWLVSQTNEDTQAEIANYFRTGVLSGGSHAMGGRSDEPNTPDLGLTRRSAPQREIDEAAETARRELARVAEDNPEVAKLLADGRLQIEVTPDGLLIQVTDGSEGLMYGLGSSTPSQALTSLLEGVAPALAGVTGNVQIHGHTDARPLGDGSGRTNWDLSFERANSARRVLESHGLPAGRITAVVGHADSDPLYRTDPLDAQNRRLSIYVLRRSAAPSRPRGLFEPAPPRETPAQESPVEEVPAQEAPAHDPPAHDPPAHDPPAHDPPAHDGH